MKYVIDSSAKKSAYLQLYEQVKSDIVSGLYPYNTKLPSKRLLAEECGVSIVTVEHSYTLLCDEGYIEPKERSGYFVIYQSKDFFSSDSLPDTKKEIDVPIHINTKTDFPFSVFARSMRKVLNDYGDGLFTKPSNYGCMQLREVLARYLERSRGIKTNPEQIIIGSGAEYLYGLIVSMLGRDRIYACEKPSYEKIELVYKANGVKFDMLPLGKDGINSKHLANTNASVLHITPYRSFPSGVTASASKKREYLYWASLGDRYIVEDDFESEFTVSKKNEETIFSLSENDNVIYMNTFSKTVSPSLRVGYMVLPTKLLDIFSKTVGFYSCTVPLFEQLVLAEIINNGDFERHINRVRRNKRKNM